ncbi:MAG: hypothetical protein N2170_04380 [Bacteroidia bacterium]|nr:hypothetical protein [Bacteroidia bacterium]
MKRYLYLCGQTHMRMRALAVALLTAGMYLLVGCGGQQQEQKQEEQKTEQTQPAEQQPASGQEQTPAEQPAQPAEGGEKK